MTPSQTATLVNQVRPLAEQAGVFGPIQISGQSLVCPAPNSAAPADYRLFQDGGRWWAALTTADRWLSGSIELDLLHTGDKMEELVEEELSALDCDHKVSKIEHFRSLDKLYTFRLAIPAPAGSQTPDPQLAATYLLAMEAAFRNLGDVDAGDEEE